MRPLNETIPAPLLPLPPGKLTVRWRQMRAVWQVFAGRTYLNGASGESPEDAVEHFARQYAATPGQVVYVQHGVKWGEKAMPIPERA